MLLIRQQPLSGAANSCCPNKVTVALLNYRDPVQTVLIANRKHRTGIIAGFVAACALTALCYWPSLNGPFVFDDIPNLEIMGERGGLTSLDHYAEFIMSAQAGPLGRPLSLASFALNSQSWPTDPYPFRVTNLVIHLINALLIFFLSRHILTSSFTREKAEKLALLCAALWLLHPLNVSTAAYVIQRMTQLCTLFTLLGLLSYIKGRNLLSDSRQKGWAWILIGMGANGFLALMSKESAILLPFYALVVEVTVFESRPIARRDKLALMGILCAPLLALIAYIAVSWDALQAGFDLRPFSMAERLLTQGVVLIDYLRQIVMPRLSGLGLIHDDFPVSQGLLDPVATIVSLSVIILMLFFAIRWRRTIPLLSLGILWFFVGHSLEAGPLPLELYFEHRNYLAMIGPLILICSLVPILSTKVRGFLPLLIALLLAFEAFLLWQTVLPWSNENRMMQIALVEHPDSLRAQQYVANKYIINGHYENALEVQESLALKFPQSTSTQLSILNLRCLLNTLTVDDVDATKRFVTRGDYDLQIVGFLRPLLNNAASGTCAPIGLADVHGLFDELIRNPSMAKSNTLIGATHYHKGIAFRMGGDLDNALLQLDLAYQSKPEIDVRLQQVVWSLELGDLTSAADYLVLAKQHGEEQLMRRSFRAADLDSLQQEIDRLRDLAATGP